MNRRDRAKTAEARYIGGIDQRHASDAIAAAVIGHGVRTDCVLERVQRHVDGAIAGCVNGHLPAACIQQPHQAVERVGFDTRRSGFLGSRLVRLQESRFK